MTTKKKTTAVAKKETADVAISEENKELAELYDDDDISQSDILVSRILLMQGQSQFVADEKAQIGEIRGSLECDLLAKKGEEIEIIPFHRYKSFRLFRPNPEGGKPTFVKEMPYDATTRQWEAQRLREVEIDGEMLQCFNTWNYFVMLANEVEAMPRMLSFSSTNFRMGKQLTTFATEAKLAGLPLPFKTYKIGAQKTSNEKGNWYIYTVAKGRKTTEEELGFVKNWAKLAKAGEVKVDEEHDEVFETSGNTSEATRAEGEVRDGDEF